MVASTTVTLAPLRPPGWTDAAIAIHSVMQMPVPLLMSLRPNGFDPMYIDFRHDAFIWAEPIEQFPVAPVSVFIETDSVRADSPPLFDLPGRRLDTLLWRIAMGSFTDGGAEWLRPTDRYRLASWPDFAVLEHTMTQMRMTSMLGSVFLSIDDLAAGSGSTHTEARRLILAFSLLGILQVTDSPVQPAVVAAPKSPGLFHRLRHRLGF